MLDVEMYVVDCEIKEKKKLVQLTAEDVSTLVLLNENYIKFLDYLRDEGLMSYYFDYKIIDKLEVKEF